jgi:predicted dehydrogenase
MAAKIKVGVVGYGNSAKKFHLPFIQAVSDLEVVAILQRAAAPSDPTTAPPGSHCTVDFPNVRHHRTSDAFFADADIDLVVVATSTASHASLGKLALQAGRHGE